MQSTLRWISAESIVLLRCSCHSVFGRLPFPASFIVVVFSVPTIFFCLNAGISGINEYDGMLVLLDVFCVVLHFCWLRLNGGITDIFNGDIVLQWGLEQNTYVHCSWNITVKKKFQKVSAAKDFRCDQLKWPNCLLFIQYKCNAKSSKLRCKRLHLTILTNSLLCPISKTQPQRTLVAERN